MGILRAVIIFFTLTILCVFSEAATVAKKAASHVAPGKTQSSNGESSKAMTSGRIPANTTSTNTGMSNSPVTSTPPSVAATGAGGLTEPVVSEDASLIKGTKKKGDVVPGPGANGASGLFEDESGFLAGLDYPELQVVPRASERLGMEAQEERSSVLTHYWPVQISSISLMLAASSASGKYKEVDPTASQKSEHQFATQSGLLIGAMWLGTTYYLDSSYSYSRSISDVRKANGKDKKSQLLKERLAEEALERPAKVANMINTISVWSNLILAAYINQHSKQGLPNYAALSMGLAFLPWLIENRVISNWEKHLEYKRKIYAPISTIDFQINPKTGEPTPLLGMQWRF